ncbi:hypothetical protein B0H13DRAFT_2301516 [Mycena leptocephala]|nr:hypothetical protein B0H13DRAFT_2301516 [Mycena leptocephala]
MGPLDFEGDIATLLYIDNDAALKSGTSNAKKPAEAVSSRGAIKLTELMGRLPNNKDKKKGQQGSHAVYFSAYENIQRTIPLPDTSHTRYQSHSEGAAEIILHLPVYRVFMAFIRDRKESQKLNHLEHNIWKGLLYIWTLHELAVLAGYGQAITHVYMKYVRGDASTNLLDLGPLHKRIIAHRKKLIRQPELIFGQKEITSMGALASRLPHLRGVMIYFLEGALEKWENFSAEFNDDGLITGMSVEEKASAWIPATNDHGLGGLRQAMWRGANSTLEFVNAKQQYKRNGIRGFVEAKLQTDACQAFMRKTAREVQEEHRSQKRRQV